jgi:hypothetical protein
MAAKSCKIALPRLQRWNGVRTAGRRCFLAAEKKARCTEIRRVIISLSRAECMDVGANKFDGRAEEKEKH